MTFRPATRKTGFIAFLIAACFVLLPAIPARADLTITPVRVVFQGRDRSASIELINVTNRTNTYRMSWMEMKMEPDGRYVLMPVTNEKDPNSVPNMVIFTPRQVTIPPQGHQTIRLSLRRPADLPPGEYRAHLLMKRLANMGPLHQDANPKGVSMNLKVNISFSVPIIVRSGEDKDLRISLSSPKFVVAGTKKNQHPQLNIDITRDAGKFSSYGLLKVYWQPPQGGEREIGMVNNVALYPELKRRTMGIDLTENPTSGQIRVVYLGKYESEGTTWAEKTFPIGK
jgi:hypothetical protein